MASKDSMTRQEDLWSGEFGRNYIERNPISIPQRMVFWEETMKALEPSRTLEIGCGVGLNLEHIWHHTEMWGLDISQEAVRISKHNFEFANIVEGSIYDLPFKDGYFDLTFTCGVLIHQHPDMVNRAMREVARCSSKWVLCIEYEAGEFEEISYHGERLSLFKGPYSTLYGELGLDRQQYGLLTKDMGFDNCSWSLLAK